MKFADVFASGSQRAGRKLFLSPLGVAAALVMALATFSASAQDLPASDSQAIAAIVNDHVISSYDLDQRIKLVILSSGIPNTPDNITRIRGQVLRSLVDEHLQGQEAQRLNIEVAQDEVDKAFDRIAQRSNMSVDQISKALEEGGVTRATLEAQIRNDIAWNRVIQQSFGPLVTVGEGEIEEVMRRLEEESGQPRYLVSEILITFDSPAHAEEIAAGTQRLVEQIRQGAPFEAVARQFSQSPSSANGGDIGWVHSSQLPDKVSEVVTRMQPGMVSDPIRTLTGFYIVQLKSMQTSTGGDPMMDQYSLMRVVLPLTPDANQQAIARRAREAEEFRAQVSSCEEAPKLIAKYVSGQSLPAEAVIAGRLPPQTRQAISGVPVGKATVPIRSDQGVEMLVICGHKAAQGELPTREQIDNTLYEQQLSMMGRRHLRDLRRDAVVVYR
ncbi:MAG: peptidylprolyl isomerase [Parvibaculum sp.]|uniref:peptidylprolyl isomerase n=1 Tax=Parvibaculum sp. TaxID=2024848 RepID=UPI002AB88BC4|nr:peptidylprolyl isomerase [Parvibaculum sp.]MDZ4381582.1 peptidylprolyl isomerase [Parvibaculum sp.]